jgi:hypothetical protein
VHQVPVPRAPVRFEWIRRTRCAGHLRQFRHTFSGKSSQPPRKPRNAERISREYLTPNEVERLLKAAERVGRYGHRDATMLLLACSPGE